LGETSPHSIVIVTCYFPPKFKFEMTSDGKLRQLLSDV
jgi:hypothetical protein